MFLENERAVWQQLASFLIDLLPTDAEPIPRHAIRVSGTTQLVPSETIQLVLVEIEDRVTKIAQKIETLQKKSVTERKRANSKAPRKATAKKKTGSKKNG